MIVTGRYHTNFNPRSHEGSDINETAQVGKVTDFNPRSHEGSDINERIGGDHGVISIHAPTKGATASSFVCCDVATDFNPRSHEGSDHPLTHIRGQAVHFNPRSHEGSDIAIFKNLWDTNISIHAPTKGATQVRFYSWEDTGISIHAPTKGATQIPDTRKNRSVISIHAPTKGATPGEHCICNSTHISIHAPTKGATWLPVMDGANKAIFQSTLPRRERREYCGSIGSVLNFNPRSHEGSDVESVRAAVQTISDFNPRSHEGSDAIETQRRRERGISIHAPTKGATD